jgi:hypothetical protein
MHFFPSFESTHAANDDGMNLDAGASREYSAGFSALLMSMRKGRPDDFTSWDLHSDWLRDIRR